MKHSVLLTPFSRLPSPIPAWQQDGDEERGLHLFTFCIHTLGAPTLLLGASEGPCPVQLAQGPLPSCPGCSPGPALSHHALPFSSINTDLPVSQPHRAPSAAPLPTPDSNTSKSVFHLVSCLIYFHNDLLEFLLCQFCLILPSSQLIFQRERGRKKHRC